MAMNTVSNCDVLTRSSQMVVKNFQAVGCASGKWKCERIFSHRSAFFQSVEVTFVDVVTFQNEKS